LSEVAKPTEEEEQHRKRLFLLAALYVAFILFAFFVLRID
jgi:hypothetical protein